MALQDLLPACVWEKSVVVRQDNDPAGPILPVMLTQVHFQAFIVEVQALVLLACAVVVNHARSIQWGQDPLGQDLVDLSVIDVRRVDLPDLSPLPQGEMYALAWLPGSVQDLPPPGCGARKQVQFKVLGGLFPPHPVTAFFPGHEHGPVAEHGFQRPHGVASLLAAPLPLRLAALVSRLPALLACHNIFIRSPDSRLVGARLNYFGPAHETG